VLVSVPSQPPITGTRAVRPVATLTA